MVESDGSFVVDIPDDVVDDSSVEGEAKVGDVEDSEDGSLEADEAVEAGGAWDEGVDPALELAEVASEVVPRAVSEVAGLLVVLDWSARPLVSMWALGADAARRRSMCLLDEVGARRVALETGAVEGSEALEETETASDEVSGDVVSGEVGDCVEAGVVVSWLLGDEVALPPAWRLTSSTTAEAKPPRASGSWPWRRPRNGPASLARERPSPTKMPRRMATASLRRAAIFRGGGGRC